MQRNPIFLYLMTEAHFADISEEVTELESTNAIIVRFGNKNLFINLSRLMNIKT